VETWKQQLHVSPSSGVARVAGHAVRALVVELRPSAAGLVGQRCLPTCHQQKSPSVRTSGALWRRRARGGKGMSAGVEAASGRQAGRQAGRPRGTPAAAAAAVVAARSPHQHGPRPPPNVGHGTTCRGRSSMGVCCGAVWLTHWTLQSHPDNSGSAASERTLRPPSPSPESLLMYTGESHPHIIMPRQPGRQSGAESRPAFPLVHICGVQWALLLFHQAPNRGLCRLWVLREGGGENAAASTASQLAAHLSATATRCTSSSSSQSTMAATQASAASSSSSSSGVMRSWKWQCVQRSQERCD
jgi:hypothetical protein